ncbi:argininosuccinate synthase [Macrococcus armenti]|uniref:argininosuccinate synthase n=1 Tax=Macrococcus armenti TaxID=2875764 RepID=UPI001CD03697|nr:argininosuccinate synthase [Macrococcus armenti]UBH16030.1 argininosuccinate synthase [Macrococcus armenti]UBH18391.1 argininosuccinate synthase [Macrococcus armenti]UBH20657.1 argininosuccinate synthase [Macrococcus armenti]
MKNKEKVVLAYSGGLDTSVAIQWLIDKGYDVIACCLDVGEGKDLKNVKEKALNVGAIASIMLDKVETYADEYLSYAIKGNSLYEDTYPLISALSRPLIAKELVKIAHQYDAKFIAHGCTGKGNDQVRFEVAIHSIDSSITTLAPVRDWGFSREEEIEYAKAHDIPVPINLNSPYSIDQNLWGRSNECGILEDPYAMPPEDAYDLTVAPKAAPDEEEIIDITFKSGLPIALNGNMMPLHEIIKQLNVIGGKHGVGRIDHVENRLVGIKSREVYEAPGAMILLTAHKDLETITLTKDVQHFKPYIEQQFSNLIYNGLFFSPLADHIKNLLTDIQQYVNGETKVKLYKGNITVIGRKSDNALYNEKLATYTKEDTFNHQASVGFIEIYELPVKQATRVYGGEQHE